jgi:23S rRNA pseudouridine1911/1915/1917 synthase
VLPRLEILYEDNHLLVVNKPAGLPTMGALRGRATAVEAAKAYLKHKYHKPGNVYLGVMSRLDAPVSGVLLLARTSKAAARLTEQFKRATVQKTYWALVQGHLHTPVGEWHDEVLKDEAAGRMRVVANGGRAARHAVLRYRQLAKVDGQILLVEVELLTGRKHQIRVQFASRGLPILGDRKYGSSAAFPTGIALHACRLCVEHPITRQTLTLQAPFPAYWKPWLPSLDAGLTGD